MRLSERLSNGIEGTPFACRPLAFLCAVLLCALFLVQISLFLFIIYALAVLVYALLLAKKQGFKLKAVFAYLLMLMLVIGLVLPLAGAMNYKKLSALEGEHTVKGVIERVYFEERYGSLYLVRLDSIDGKRANGRATLEIDEPLGLVPFDTVTVKGELTDAREGLSGPDELIAKSRDICIDLKAVEVLSVTNEAKIGLNYRLYLTRNAIEARLYKLLPHSVAGYASALVIGEKAGLSDKLVYSMSALGISHILAVSGMHLSIISVMIAFACDKLKSSRRLVSVSIISGTFVFMGLAGFSASVVRAGIMLIISMLAPFFGSKSDPLTSLMLSGVIICIINPPTVISCSFLLSFFATLGIVLCGIYAQKRARVELYASRVGDMKCVYKIIKGIAFSLLITLCATLFTAPVMSLYFSEMSFFSFAVNPIAIPVAFASMLLTVLCLIFGNIPLVGAMLCKAFVFLYTAFEGLVSRCALYFSTSVSLKYPFFVPILILLAAILTFLTVRRIKNPIAVVSAFLTCAVIFAGCVQIHTAVNADTGEVAYICSPTAEGIVLTSGSKTMYIDIGNGSKTVPMYGVKEARESYYETELDAYMLTHYHSLHIKTFKRLVNNIEIKTLYLPTPETESEQTYYGIICELMKNSKIITYKRGDTVTFGNAKIESIKRCVLERSEHPVMAMCFTYGKKSVTYLGSSISESDICIDAEKFIAKSDAIICGRHGPVTKEDNKFLAYRINVPVYLSPFEDTNELVAFEGGKYTRLIANEEKIAGITLRVAD